jgi:hypothetical protein
MRFPTSPTRRVRLERAALGYVRHGWPVMPGAQLVGSRFSCGPGCRTVACHPIAPVAVTRDPAAVRAWWRHGAWSVLLATGSAFDAVDLPAGLGTRLLGAAPPGPVLATPDGRWLFLVRSGDPLRPELAAHADIVLHAAGSWVAAPPTPFVAGRKRWVVAPRQVGWRLPGTYELQRAVLPLVTRTRTVARTVTVSRHAA